MNANNMSRKYKLECQRITIDAEWSMEVNIRKLNNEQFVYRNQQEAATECVKAFHEGITQVCLVAQPGTGKTGASLEVMRQVTTHPDDNICIPTNHLWILSGMNDKEWSNQYFKNMIKPFREHITHRGNLMKNKTEISQINNGLLITDECQIACGKNMTVSKMLRESGLTDLKTINTRKMKMLDISATPESVSFDLHSPEWRDKSRIVKLLPGPIYKGFQHMLDDGRIFDAPDISSSNDGPKVVALLTQFQNRYEGTTRKYFPFRVRGVAKGHLHSAITELGWDFIEHDSSIKDDVNPVKYYDDSGEEISKIDHMMMFAPIKHTVIFVKEYWRASKRLVRRHVGGSFVPIPKKRNTTAASQDLVARFCDNYEYSGDQVNPNYRPIHYTDKDAIKEYLNWFNNGCDYKMANYTSNRITSTNGNVRAKPSKVHISNMRNLDANPNRRQYCSLRVPIVVPLPELQRTYITESLKGMRNSKSAKNEIIRGIVDSYFTGRPQTPEMAEFIEVIHSSECFQISTPTTDGSYDKNIIKTVDAYENNKTLKVKDKTTELQSNRNWQCFVDNRMFRLCFLWEVRIMKVPVSIELLEENIAQIEMGADKDQIIRGLVQGRLSPDVIQIINTTISQYQYVAGQHDEQIQRIIQSYESNQPFEITGSDDEHVWQWFINQTKIYIVWR
jgi:hypothetical protein